MARAISAALGIFSFVTPAFAADAACHPMFDAATKLLTVPAHSYTTETLPDGKSHTGELIYANGAIYLNLRANGLAAS